MLFSTAMVTPPSTSMPAPSPALFAVSVLAPEHQGRARLRERRAQLAERSARTGGAADVIRSPMQGTVLKVAVEAGAEVEAGQVLVVVEAMKMENELKSPKAGKVLEVFAKEGSTVEANAKLLSVE